MQPGRRPFGTLPPALILGYALIVLAMVVQAASALLAEQPYVSERWMIASDAMRISSGALLAVGWSDLAQRSTGRARRLLQLAVAGIVVGLVWAATYPIAFDVLLHRSADGIDARAFNYLSFAVSLVSLAAMILIPTAADSWRRAPHLAALVVVPAVLREVTMFLPQPSRWLAEHRGAQVGWYLVLATSIAAGLLAIANELDRDDPAVVPRPELARAGLRRAARAIWFSVICGLGAGLLFVPGIPAEPLLKAAVDSAPLVSIVALAAFSVGVLTAARSRLPDLSPWLLTVAGALVLLFASVQSAQLTALYHLIDGTGDLASSSQILTAWRILGPTVGIAGMLLVIHAVSRFALARANDPLREAASVRGVLFLVLMGSCVGLMLQISKARSEVSALLILATCAGAGIGALIALAQVCARGAATIDEVQTLPEARLR